MGFLNLTYGQVNGKPYSKEITVYNKEQKELLLESALGVKIEIVGYTKSSITYRLSSGRAATVKQAIEDYYWALKG